jgi:hypothetical protein
MDSWAADCGGRLVTPGVIAIVIKMEETKAENRRLLHFHFYMIRKNITA